MEVTERLICECYLMSPSHHSHTRHEEISHTPNFSFITPPRPYTHAHTPALCRIHTSFRMSETNSARHLRNPRLRRRVWKPKRSVNARKPRPPRYTKTLSPRSTRARQKDLRLHRRSVGDTDAAEWDSEGWEVAARRGGDIFRAGAGVWAVCRRPH